MTENTQPENDAEITVNLSGIKAKKISGEILTVPSLNSYNDFGKPTEVMLQDLKPEL